MCTHIKDEDVNVLLPVSPLPNAIAEGRGCGLIDHAEDLHLGLFARLWGGGVMDVGKFGHLGSVGC